MPFRNAASAVNWMLSTEHRHCEYPRVSTQSLHSPKLHTLHQIIKCSCVLQVKHGPWHACTIVSGVSKMLAAFRSVGFCQLRSYLAVPALSLSAQLCHWSMSLELIPEWCLHVAVARQGAILDCIAHCHDRIIFRTVKSRILCRVDRMKDIRGLYGVVYPLRISPAIT